MPIVQSSNFVLSDSTPAFPVTADHPVVGYHNLVTATNVVATHADADYPASNLANPATHLDWRSDDDGTQYLTVTTDYVDEIDYLAIAGHNLGSDQIPASLEGYIGGSWTELVAEQTFANDSPILFRFTAQSLSDIRLKMVAPTDAFPRIAVMYIGKLLTLPRKLWVGHTPINQGRKTEILSGRSESGKFLGRVQIGEWRETVIPLSLIDPEWYRDYGGDEFLAASALTPFFFGWRPESYPNEIGYCWTTEDPMPVPTSSGNLIAFDIKVSGVA